VHDFNHPGKECLFMCYYRGKTKVACQKREETSARPDTGENQVLEAEHETPKLKGFEQEESAEREEAAAGV
jgi:hypothetical protein